MQKTKRINKLEEIQLLKEVNETKSLYATFNSGINWVDALNASVRPILAYGFFILYAAIKYFQYAKIGKNLPFEIYLNLLWTVDDQAIFAGIISFYFGQRTFSKFRK